MVRTCATGVDNNITPVAHVRTITAQATTKHRSNSIMLYHDDHDIVWMHNPDAITLIWRKTVESNLHSNDQENPRRLWPRRIYLSTPKTIQPIPVSDRHSGAHLSTVDNKPSDSSSITAAQEPATAEKPDIELSATIMDPIHARRTDIFGVLGPPRMEKMSWNATPTRKADGLSLHAVIDTQPSSRSTQVHTDQQPLRTTLARWSPSTEEANGRKIWRVAATDERKPGN